MDPNTLLRQMEEALEKYNNLEALEYAWYLEIWLDKGGFQPEWDNYPEAKRFYSSRGLKK